MKRVLVVVLLGSIGCGREPLGSAEARAAAETIWKDRCATCHGVAGSGDGPGAKLLPVKPRNLTDVRWQEGVTDERIAKVIVDGGKSVGLDSNMAANPDLSNQPEVVAALVEIIRGR